MLCGVIVEAFEDGVFVFVGVHVKRFVGEEQLCIVILCFSGDGVTVVGLVFVLVNSLIGAIEELDGLHLVVQCGDSIGMFVPVG